MENLNAEFIIESLEYFIEDECASRTVVHDALDLIKSQEQKIKELTEENERLKNSITFQVVMPDEKMEEIKAECLKRVELDVKEFKSNTAREMLERAIDNGVCKEIADGTERLFVSIEKLREIAKEIENE